MFIKLTLDNNFYEPNGNLKNEYKFCLNAEEFKVKNSKIISNPEDKFETLLFLPIGEGRKGEGGLRTKGYFKFSYKYMDGDWFICDIEGNPLKPAPADIQEKINSYIASLPEDIRHKVTELPLITVITVVLNGEKYLEQTIQSVINQTYPNVEYIIIDGGSTDGTLDIIKKYEDRIDYWVSEKDRGIYDAMNKGTILSLGFYCFYLGEGDKFLEKETVRKLTTKIFSFKKNKLSLIVTPIKLDTKKYFSYPDLEEPPIIHHQSSFFCMSSLKKIGLYDLKYEIHSDFDLILRYVKVFGYVSIDDFAVCNFRINGISNSGKYTLTQIKELSHIYLKNGGNLFSFRFLKLIARPLYYYLRKIYFSDLKCCF